MNYLHPQIIAENKDKQLSYIQVIDYAAEKIIDFQYPIYGINTEEKEYFRRELTKQIVRHNLMKEIGYETPELWKIMMYEKLTLIMPKYEQLYKSTLFEINLEEPYKLVTEHQGGQVDDRNINRKTGKTGLENGTSISHNMRDFDSKMINDSTNSQNNTENSSSSGKVIVNNHSIEYESDFPQASFEQGNYATSGLNTDSDSTTDSSDSTNRTNDIKGSSKSTDTNATTEDITGGSQTGREWKDDISERSNDINTMVNKWLEEVKGHVNNMDVLEAVEKWRELIININQMILDELSTMFMMIY